LDLSQPVSLDARDTAAAIVLEVAEADIRKQMDMLYRRDRWMALSFIGLLVVVLPFILVALWDVTPDTGSRVVLIVAGGILAAYNVASIVKMVRNYRRDRDFIYRRDVVHLAELRLARRAGRAGR
jgi:hypothetical protein